MSSLNLFPVLVRIPTLRGGYAGLQLALLWGCPGGRRFANAPLFFVLRSLFTVPYSL